ncbi:uncharacterized protein LOC144243445 [Crocuta crocuta]
MFRSSARTWVSRFFSLLRFSGKPCGIGASAPGAAPRSEALRQPLLPRKWPGNCSLWKTLQVLEMLFNQRQIFCGASETQASSRVLHLRGSPRQLSVAEGGEASMGRGARLQPESTSIGSAWVHDMECSVGLVPFFSAQPHNYMWQPEVHLRI